MTQDLASPAQIENDEGNELIPLGTICLSREERACLKLMLDGEKRTIVFTRVLGLAGEPEAVQVRQIYLEG
jgi:hypothetical protein